jgi:hypothetical protein
LGVKRASKKEDCFPAKAGIQTGLPPSRENKGRGGRSDHYTTPAEAGAQLERSW